MEIMLEIPLTVWNLVRVLFKHTPGHPGFSLCLVNFFFLIFSHTTIDRE